MVKRYKMTDIIIVRVRETATQEKYYITPWRPGGGSSPLNRGQEHH